MILCYLYQVWLVIYELVALINLNYIEHSYASIYIIYIVISIVSMNYTTPKYIDQLCACVCVYYIISIYIYINCVPGIFPSFPCFSLVSLVSLVASSKRTGNSSQGLLQSSTESLYTSKAVQKYLRTVASVQRLGGPQKGSPLVTVTGVLCRKPGFFSGKTQQQFWNILKAFESYVDICRLKFSSYDFGNNEFGNQRKSEIPSFVNLAEGRCWG